MLTCFRLLMANLVAVIFHGAFKTEGWIEVVRLVAMAISLRSSDLCVLCMVGNDDRNGYSPCLSLQDHFTSLGVLNVRNMF